jgi:hypothetical protein
MRGGPAGGAGRACKDSEAMYDEKGFDFKKHGMMESIPV